MILKKLLLVLFLLPIFLLLIGNFSKVNAVTFEEQLVDLINTERQNVSLPALSNSDKLFQSSENHNKTMADCAISNGVDACFEHQVSLVGESTTMERIRATGYNPQATSENIAWGYQTPKEVIEAWMQSSGHKDNILGSYKDIGCDHLDSMNGSYKGIYWTCDFGKSFSTTITNTSTPTNKPSNTPTLKSTLAPTKILIPTRKPTATLTPTRRITPSLVPTKKTALTPTLTPKPTLTSNSVHIPTQAKPWWCIFIPTYPSCK